MTNPTGWECSRCGLVLAPHVAEHRCDPPTAGTLATVTPPPSPPSTGTYCVTSTSGATGAVVVSINGTVLTGQELAEHIQRAALQHATNSWTGRFPGRTA